LIAVESETKNCERIVKKELGNSNTTLYFFCFGGSIDQQKHEATALQVRNYSREQADDEVSSLLSPFLILWRRKNRDHLAPAMIFSTAHF
jgi:hypothetical protein